MHQIRALNRTKAGTDGPVYIYPYLGCDVPAEKKVAKCKYQLLKNLLAQGIHYLLVAAFFFYTPLKDDIMYLPGIFFVTLGFLLLISSISIELGESGGSGRIRDFDIPLRLGLLFCIMFTYALFLRHIDLLKNMEEVHSSYLKLLILTIVTPIMDRTNKLLDISDSLRTKMMDLRFQRIRATGVMIQVR